MKKSTILIITQRKVVTHKFIPDRIPVTIVLTSGASCPDTIVDRVMLKLAGYFADVKEVEDVIKGY